MKYNRFYNKDVFNAVSGSEVVFVYKRVSLKRTDGKVIFPFYLMMKPFQIEFNYYGPKYSTVQNHEDNDGEWQRTNHGDEPELPELKHRELFTLTLSDDYSVNKMLEKELRDIYSGSINLSRFLEQQESSHLNNTSPEYRLTIETSDLYQPGSQDTQTFAELEPLLSYNSIKPATIGQEYSAKENEGVLQYRTMLLDFIFDLIETKKAYSDFAYNPYFDEVEQRLMANHFFFSLCMMHSYKFRKEKLKTAIKIQGLKKYEIKTSIKKMKKLAIIQTLRDSLCELLNDTKIIYLSQKAEINLLFHEKNLEEFAEPFILFAEKNTPIKNADKLYDTFLEKEAHYHFSIRIRHAAEVAAELNKAKNSWLRALSHEKANENINARNKWFEHIEREREIVFGIQKYISAMPHMRLINFFRNFFHFRLRKKDKFAECNRLMELNAYFQLDYETYYETENDNLDHSARWFLDRYNISSALKLYSPSFTIIIKLFVMVVLLFSFLELLTLNNMDFQNTFNVWLLIANGAALAMFLLMTIIALGKSLALTIVSVFPRKNNTFMWYHSFLWSKYRQHRVSGRIIGFFMPKLLMAILSGWVILLTAEEVWKSVFDIELSKAVKLALVLITMLLLYVGLEIQKVKPKISIYQVASRTAFLIAFGLFYSNIIGITTITISSERMLVRSGYLEDYFKAIVDKENASPHYYLDSTEHDSVMKILEDASPVSAKNEKLMPYVREIFIHKDQQTHLLSFLPERIHNKLDFIRILPGMLLINTVIALFIGIFLQMLFDRRNIVEPI
jgi:hypothetical protein